MADTKTTITFKNEHEGLNLIVFGDDQSECETLLKEYLGITWGGLEKSVRVNAEEYYFTDKKVKATESGVESLDTIHDHEYGEIVINRRFMPASKILW